MTEQDHQHRPPRREFERHSGTGRPIKGENKRQGGGVSNWGSEQETMQQGMNEFNSENKNPEQRKPLNQGDLNELVDKEEEQKTSYDEFAKQSNIQQTAYNTKTVASQYKKAQRLNKSERETDLLFAGDQKDKKKRNKKKKTKQLLVTSFTYQNEQESRGRGRGRGGGRGGYDNQNTGNFGNQGFNRGRGGFGSRGRGRRNENFDTSFASAADDGNQNVDSINQTFSQATNAAPKQHYRKKRAITSDN